MIKYWENKDSIDYQPTAIRYWNNLNLEITCPIFGPQGIHLGYISASNIKISISFLNKGFFV